MSRIMVGLSGGVDSAVAALLLQREGHRVTAVFMKNWDDDDDAGYCPAEEDLKDARRVCELLELELRTVSFSAEYWQRVFLQFLDEYQSGRTPNPDIVCNQEIKFRAFLDYALSSGADAIATGHYAQLGTNAGPRLLRGADRSKDQTYFLHRLTRAQLEKSRFPVGHLHKTSVRDLAVAAGLPNHAKKDSTGICFIGERKFRDFLAQYLPEQPGEIRTLDGERVGTHRGLMFYTIGQRQGLGIGGRKEAAGDPWYVAGKDLRHNVLQVVQGFDHPALYHQRLSASEVHWIAGHAPGSPCSCTARIRHLQEDQPCRVMLEPGERCTVDFSKPQRAVTPGQSVVFYAGEECLGGGLIEAAR
jgi:tRNA-specific 2-thiouridylase